MTEPRAEPIVGNLPAHRDPLCASCGKRHPIGMATACEDLEGIWRCGRCGAVLDIDQECPEEECCGYRI